MYEPLTFLMLYSFKRCSSWCEISYN